MIVDPWKNDRFRLGRTFVSTVSSSLAILLLASCVSSGSSPDENSESPAVADSPRPSASAPEGGTSKKVIASTRTSSTEIGREFRIDIHSLRRTGSDAVILDFSMVNLSATERVYPYSPPEGTESPGDKQTFTLIDGSNKKKHLPLVYTDESCYCADWNDAELAPGKSINAWIAFPAPPDDVSAMTFMSAATPPILDIPIGSGEGDLHRPEKEIVPPQIWDLHSISDNLSNGSTRNEGPDEVAISLSSDVLFDTNKSVLNESARKTIQQVAQEIEDSNTAEVRVDGHTDDTGSDAINNPLSKERAEAVHELLTNLVDRKIEYAVAGHGSSTPIATNDTEEGRSKNRRVTITFTR